MNKRPITYKEWRAEYHRALHDAGSAGTELMQARLNLQSRLKSVSDESALARRARWFWKSTWRAHRIERRLDAFWDAMSSDVCEAILDMVMDEREEESP